MNSEAKAPATRPAAEETSVPLTRSEAREIVEFMDGVRGYLTTAWAGLEEIADEANAGIRIFKTDRGEAVGEDDFYDEIENVRRKAAKAIRFALANVEHIHEMLNARAYSSGKYAAPAPSEDGAT